ncbi:Glucosaminyl phosphatidylinositol (GlcN-PI) nositol acylation protein [Knufia fluminis]|uniref:GPI-anchored wall transfer protein n=1 Tax=Knufia fluminis TaxID=191047 RepID=A0AAN8EDC9_9EURO|nr:Glucosaminyl phosphatidylinositol (GlcN-PI) nositol acylation protein [Knufia fluminis]
MDDPNPAARAEALSYKLRKEAFVSNLSGSSLTDINLVTLVAASAILLWTALSKRDLLGDSSLVVYAIDFLLNVCAILFAFTAYASAPIFLNLALIVPAGLLLLPLQQQARSRRSTSKATSDGTAQNGGTRTIHTDGKGKAQPKADITLQPGTLITRPFLTNYRGAMLIATCLAILAVDFHVFPRRFAKVETWGTSLMDLGVGSFVFSAGLVGARAVIRDGQRSASASHRQGVSIESRMFAACKHSIPLFVLGIARLISVKNLDYAEHVTEYGVHWNFFFTLGFLPPFVEAVDCCLAFLRGSASTGSRSRSIRYDVVALLISLTHELVLNNTNLLAFILIAPRTPNSDLLTKNREGVFSFIGYLTIFLSGRSTGILVCQFQDATITKPATTKKGASGTEIEQQQVAAERKKVVLPNLLIRAEVYALLYLVSTNVYAANLTVSRRLANLPYILWIVAYNNAQLFLFALIEAVGPRFTFSKQEYHDSASAVEIASPIMRAFNQSGLALFLIANLGTGVVNLSLDTLDMGNGSAMAMLLGYAGVLSVTAICMERAGIKIKI